MCMLISPKPKQTCVLNGIQFTKHFIEFVTVETNEKFFRISNVIFTRQTCCQRSSRAVGNKLRAVAFYFVEWIWYVFLISKCRGESGVGLCMTLVLVKRMRFHSAHFWFKACLVAKFVGSRHCAAEFSVQVLKSSTDLHPTVLYILIFRTHTKFIRKNKMLPLGVCFP